MNVLINYNTSLDVVQYKKNFTNYFKDVFIKLHRERIKENIVKLTSKKVYNLYFYDIAFDYCITLKYIKESKNLTWSEVKNRYKFNDIRTNLAHMNIDIDVILSIVTRELAIPIIEHEDI